MVLTLLTSQLLIFPLKVDLSLNREFISVIREVSHVSIPPYKSIALSWLEHHASTAVCNSAFVDGLKDDSSAISFEPTAPETSARKL